MRLVLSFAIFFGFCTAASAGYQASNGEIYPWCTEKAIDPDLDGWGWENEASCKMPSKPPVEDNTPAEDGAKMSDQLPIIGGLPTYGTGYNCYRYGVLGVGRGRVCCPNQHEEDEDVIYKTTTAKGRYFGEHPMPTCARNEAVLRCAFENPVQECEENVYRWY